MEERLPQYQLVKSKSGLTVPLIDEVYLHSMYSPAKEAEGFAKLHAETLARKKNVIILGLGFGYHIEEVAKILNQNHEDYRIIVIERNEELFNDFNEKRKFEDKRILPILTTDPEYLFLRDDFIEFLLTSPAIIKHDTSFMLNQKFYTDFLQYKASTSISQLRRFSQHLDQFVSEAQELDPNLEMADYTAQIKRNKTFTRQDYLTLAFEELLNL